MDSLPRTIAWIGIVLIVIGAIGGGIGEYHLLSNPCRSGYQLTVDTVSRDTTAPGTRTNFSALSATNQRLFLEALTAPTRHSRTYGSTGTFDTITQRQIVYRKRAYITNVVAVDCASTPYGLFTAVGGGNSLVIGILFTLFASLR